ncbi:hypothetical protein PCE1_003056 [Barthelona sp. PCE]
MAIHKNKPLSRHSGFRKAPKVQHLTPGRVCIVLAGKYRGYRSVVVKTTESGLAVVSSFALNGMPMRRVNPAYLMPTSTHLDVDFSALNVEQYNDEFFQTKNEGLTEERKAAQKAVDGAILGGVKKAPKHMKAYLKSRFTLRNGDYPHMMKF